MDVFEFAMQMELDGKAFYEKSAREINDEELRKVLTMLAEEEDKHYTIFKRVREGKTGALKEGAAIHSKTLDAVKNIFVDMSNHTESRSFAKDEHSIWEKALTIEQKSEEFYRERAEQETDSAKRDLLTMIANEERNHIYLIDSVLTYMKFPDTFADSAQFKDFQSLEGH
ncbi:MAG: ferritin family protein [Candidatus Zixiibacteriota bacterium]|nr:MAG: ferritin family protein [candidate division Zixibacteria bacterium]